MTIESMGDMPFLVRTMKEWSVNNDMACPTCGTVLLSMRNGERNGIENVQIVCGECGMTSDVCDIESEIIKWLNIFTRDASRDSTAWDEFMDGIMEPEDQETSTVFAQACNDNIVDLMEEENITSEDIVENVTTAFEGVLDALLIDTDNDHNTQDTARRVAKMYVNEIFKGRYQPMPKVTAFPNAKQYDQIYTVDEIELRSTCAHHLQPIVGRVWVAIYPGDKVIGLSKFARIIDWIGSRPTIQEELVEQIADVLEEVTGARGVMVVVKAEHGCCTNRGIKAHSSNMTTSVVRGMFKTDKDMKAEAISMFQNFG